MNTNSCLVDLTDVTLAFEDANSKLADVDAEKRVEDGLVQIWKLNFGLIKLNLCSDFEYKVWSR